MFPDHEPAMHAARRPENVPRSMHRFGRLPNDPQRMALSAEHAPRVEWSQFIREHFQWDPGQHVAMVGPTNSGKTTLTLSIIGLRQYVASFITKPRDKTADYLMHRMGFVKFERWQSVDPRRYPRRVLWPDATTLGSEERQKAVFHHAFGAIYREGHWVVNIDELWYMSEVLGLKRDVRIYLQQARSLGISLLCGTQRPAWVPVEVYDQSTHLFFWRDNDERNLSRLSGISWLSSGVVKFTIARLEEHQVLYINTRTGKMARTRCPPIPHVGGEK